jgi:hypothetical protein
MLNRRDLFAGGTAVAALAALPFARARATLTAVPPLGAASLVIIDRALPQAAGYAAAAMLAGDVRLFERDAAALWMNEIEPRLRAGPVAIGGLTGEGTLFCLELMARDYGAEVVQRSAAGPGAVWWEMTTRSGRRAPLAPRGG